MPLTVSTCFSVWSGDSDKGRETMEEESFTLSLRTGHWKYFSPQTNPVPGWLQNKNIETGLGPYPRLYNLAEDTAEQHNLAQGASEHVKRTGRMEVILNTIQRQAHDQGITRVNQF